MAMAVLNGLPPRFETIITALDAIGDDDASFTFDKVRSRLLQEERRSSMRGKSKKTESELALLNRPQDLSALQTKRSARTVAGQTTPNHTVGRSMGVRLARIENRKGKTVTRMSKKQLLSLSQH